MRNMVFRNITVWNEADYEGISQAFDVSAFPEKPITNVMLENMKIQAKELGRLSGIKAWNWIDVEISTEQPK